MKTKVSPDMRTGLSSKLRLNSGDSAVDLTFDLEKVRMTKEQKALVLKLLTQDPEADIFKELPSNREELKTGPGSKYLTPEEFEKVRTLGVRLGTEEVLAGIIIDFCLHAIKVGANASWAGGIG